MECHVYWLLKSFSFEIFEDGKYGLFSSQKVDGNMIFIDYWKVLVLNFSKMGIMVFFFSQKVDGKMIFTWSFWAFHDIPGLGKYGFSCSASDVLKRAKPPLFLNFLNKFLRYLLNILLKLCKKETTPTLNSCKKLQVLEKKFWGKKSFQLFFADNIFYTVCEKFFQLNRCRDSGDIKVYKNCFLQ